MTSSLASRPSRHLAAAASALITRPSDEMKTNSKIIIQAGNVYLVPYRKEHVLKYHGWMECAELREQTSSEQLSLQQEYLMQETWFNDDNKCTFIVLDAEIYENTRDEVEAMIGDVNLFIDEEDASRAEISVMIAERDFHRRGKGRAAILSMLRYGFEELGVRAFAAKIGTANAASVSLFLDVGFEEVSRSSAFDEVLLLRDVGGRSGRSITSSYRILCKG